MKNIALFLLLLIILPVRLAGEVVDSLRAKALASDFIATMLVKDPQSHLKSISLKNVALKLAHCELDDSGQPGGAVSYYIYNLDGNNGFIIVSGDDSASPILGYSYEGRYDSINQPPTFKSWMKSYKEQIRSLRQMKAAPYVASIALSSSSGLSLRSAQATDAAQVLPLVTANWNQTCYYNTYCPSSSDGPCGRSYVGCVAVAMAQILNYWKAPYQCNTIPGYVSRTNAYEIPASSPTVFRWEDMTNQLSYYSLTSSVDAVSRLLYLCGTSIEMNYTGSSSGAYSTALPYALWKYFKYQSGIAYLDRSSYGSTAWLNIIKKELDNSRPIVYTGWTLKNEGHAFVCDGYQYSSYFHINWGWNGYYNGYFLLDALSPYSGADFNSYQGAVIGITPTLQISQTADTLQASADSSRISISTNGIWEATSNQSWLRIITPTGNESGTLDFVADNNNSHLIREATITVKLKTKLVQTIKVSQLSTNPVGALVVYPDPTTEGQIITTEINDYPENVNKYNLLVCSGNGGLVYRCDVVTQKVTLPALKAGVYLVSLQLKNGKRIDGKKLIVSK